MEVIHRNILEVQARAFCRIAHGDQKRKYTGEPYYFHPWAVGDIVKSVGGDLNMVCAAILHDTLEDTKTNMGDLSLFFNDDIAQLVYEVSDISRPEDGNRAARKLKDRMHFASASPRGKTIKLADLIHNTQTIVGYDKGFAKVYLQEKRELLKYLGEGDYKLYQWAVALSMA